MLAKPQKDNGPLQIILIGASAGGLEALQLFLRNYPIHLKQSCVIVAQHMSTSHKSMLVQLLAKETWMEVQEATDKEMLQAGKLYVAPANKNISLDKNKIKLLKPTSVVGPKPSIDILFNSISHKDCDSIVGIILSGTGSDGANGVRHLHAEGALLLAQDPSTAKFNGMPQSAIDTDSIDMIMPAEKMGQSIDQYINHPEKLLIKPGTELLQSTAWNKIFSLLGKHKGTDFTHYKPSTVGRRLNKRLDSLNIDSIEEYQVYLESNPSELDLLFSNLLINVTNFFRDKAAFKSLEATIDKILQRKADDAPIRIWIVACATGEEAFSIAMILQHKMELLQKKYPVQIFATDLSESAIQIARKGIYNAESLHNIPVNYRKKYFIQKGENYEVEKDIRAMILFSKHDITTNPPFLKIDLLSCRNLLIYFDESLHQKIIPVFHYSLVPDGFLFLGKAETIGKLTDLFGVVDEKNRIFFRKQIKVMHPAKFLIHGSSKRGNKAIDTLVDPIKSISVQDLIKETLYKTHEHPFVVINPQYIIQEVTGDVRLYLSMPEGTANMNVLKLINKELLPELRLAVSKCMKLQILVKSSVRKFELYDKTYFVRLQVKPLIGEWQNEKLYLVIFEQIQDADPGFSKAGALQLAADDIRQLDAEKELIAVREELGVYIEELEQTSEELQSLNEELHSSNEELQTTNEELETTNEELQSTNEEVQITYHELKVALNELEQKEKIIELSEANLYALLNNSLQSFFLVDRNYKILTFNDTAAGTINFLNDHPLVEGDSFIDFIPRSQLAQFLDDFSSAVSGKSATGILLFETKRNEKKWYSYNFTAAIRKSGGVPAISIGLLDITEQKILSEHLAIKEKLVAAVFNATSIGIVVTDETGIIEDTNIAFCNIYGYEKKELLGKSFSMLMTASNRERALQKHQSFINGDLKEMGAEWETIRKDGSQLFIHSSASLLIQDDGRRYKVESVRDISEDININRLIHVSNLKYRAIVENTSQAFFLTNVAGKILESNKAAADLFGYNASEFQNMDLSQLLFVPGNTSVDILNDFLNQANINAELDGIKKNHQQFVCEISTSTFYDENGEPCRSIMLNDVSNRKIQELKMEELLSKTRATTSMLENLFSSINDGFAAIDENWNFIYVNKMARGFLNGHSRENLIGKNIWTEFPHLVGTPIYAAFLSVMNSRKANTVEHYSISENKFYENRVYPLADNGLTILLSDVTDNKKIDAELKQSRNEMASILNNTDEIFLVLDANHKIITFNTAAENVAQVLFGKRLTKGYNYLDIVSDDRKEFYQNIVTQVLEGEKISYTIPVKNTAGEKYVFQLNYSVLANDEAGCGNFMITARDITKEENAVAEIIKSQQLLNQAESIAKVGSWELDLQSNQLYWSDGVFKMCGYEPGEFEVNFETGLSVIHPDDRAAAIAAMETTIKEGKEYIINKRLLRKDGSIRQIISQGKLIKDADEVPLKLVGVFYDVTELRLIENTLAISQQEYQSLFDQNPEAVVSLDLRGNFISINKAAAALFNCTKEELLQNGLHSLAKGEDVDILKAYFRKAKKGEAQNFETDIISFDQQTKKVIITMMPIVVNDGITGVYGMIKDITQKKLADIELTSLYKQLEERAGELEKSNEELEQFAYVASHDLQEPLRMVTSFLQLLENKYVAQFDERGREYIHFAVDGSLRMKRLIQDLLDYSRIATNKQTLGKTDMNAVVTEVLQNLSIQIQEQQAVFSVGTLPVLQAADKLQMIQLMQNLISNAVKYSTPGNCFIEITTEESAFDWKFAIADTGIGFDPLYANKIFVIFQRLHGKGTYSGTGIGLAICKKIVERHGGSIIAQSTPGAGSIFSFTINKNLLTEN